MKSIVALALATLVIPLSANAQVVVSNDCTLSRFIEAYAWQAVEDAERLPASAAIQNGLRVYLRTVQQQTKNVCRSAS